MCRGVPSSAGGPTTRNRKPLALAAFQRPFAACEQSPFASRPLACRLRGGGREAAPGRLGRDLQPARRRVLAAPCRRRPPRTCARQAPRVLW